MKYDELVVAGAVHAAPSAHSLVSNADIDSRVAAALAAASTAAAQLAEMQPQMMVVRPDFDSLTVAHATLRGEADGFTSLVRSAIATNDYKEVASTVSRADAAFAAAKAAAATSAVDKAAASPAGFDDGDVELHDSSDDARPKKALLDNHGDAPNPKKANVSAAQGVGSGS